MKPHSLEIVWTPERLEVLKEMRERNITYAQIARDMGCTRNSVVSAWHRRINPHVTFSRLSKAKKRQRIDEINSMIEEEKLRQIPTLAWVPNLRENARYKMLEVTA